MFPTILPRAMQFNGRVITSRTCAAWRVHRWYVADGVFSPWRHKTNPTPELTKLIRYISREVETLEGHRCERNVWPFSCSFSYNNKIAKIYRGTHPDPSCLFWTFISKMQNKCKVPRGIEKARVIGILLFKKNVVFRTNALNWNWSVECKSVAYFIFTESRELCCQCQWQKEWRWKMSISFKLPG